MKWRGIFLSLVLVPLLVGADEKGGSPAPVGRDTLSFDPSRSHVHLLPKSKKGYFNGTLGVKGGSVVLKYGVLTSAKIVLDLNQLMMGGGTPGWKAKVIVHLKGKDFFAVDQFPTATFYLNSVTPIKKSVGEYDVAGDLSLKGVKKPVRFKVKMVADKGVYSVSGKVVLDTASWGIRYKSEEFNELFHGRALKDYFELTFALKTF